MAIGSGSVYSTICLCVWCGRVKATVSIFAVRPIIRSTKPHQNVYFDWKRTSNRLEYGLQICYLLSAINFFCFIYFFWFLLPVHFIVTFLIFPCVARRCVHVFIFDEWFHTTRWGDTLTQNMIFSDLDFRKHERKLQKRRRTKYKN